MSQQEDRITGSPFSKWIDSSIPPATRATAGKMPAAGATARRPL
jgi:hypothetical protein